VDSHGFSHYRKSVNPRAKNDRLDAKALRRFAEKSLTVFGRLNLRIRKTAAPQRSSRTARDPGQAKNGVETVRERVEKAPSASKRTLVSMDKSIDELDRRLRRSLSGTRSTRDSWRWTVSANLAPALVWLFSDKSLRIPIRLSLSPEWTLRLDNAGKLRAGANSPTGASLHQKAPLLRLKQPST